MKIKKMSPVTKLVEEMYQSMQDKVFLEKDGKKITLKELAPAEQIVALGGFLLAMSPEARAIKRN